MTEEAKAQCTVDELLDIITFSSGGFTMMPSRDMDEVYPQIFVGDKHSAKSIAKLKRLGITHILNTALGQDRLHVDSTLETYKDIGAEFKGIEVTDHNSFQLKPFFEESAEFIDKALRSGGKVLIHCCEGASRSATIAIAYLMLHHHMTAQDAVRHIRKHREICPNDGFLQQLCDLNEELYAKGHFKSESGAAAANTAD
ncbi:Dual specificity protein phosphatase 3 [Lamellibrachia satsuma]|nr:Dual specificity protein phosphatase 3 [Lamellibrachia satsuma]